MLRCGTQKGTLVPDVCHAIQFTLDGLQHILPCYLLLETARATPDFGNAHHPISTSISLKTTLGKNIKK